MQDSTICAAWWQVTSIEQDILSFDIIVETLRATNLGQLRPGSYVNYER